MSRKIPLSEKICQVLKDRIISRTYPPRKALLEKEICEEFGVSRTPFREAVKKLEELKLVEVMPRYGTYVSQINFQEVKCAFEVRLSLEPLACGLAAERRTTEQLRTIKSLIEEDEVLVRSQGLVLLGSNTDRRCHEAIADAAHNSVLAGELERLRIICARISTSTWLEKVPSSEFSSQWKAIYRALKDRNGEAAREYMVAHIRSTISRLKEEFINDLYERANTSRS
jgi:GntR family transcriptional regulator, rspAB operon transcriptional repressor